MQWHADELIDRITQQLQKQREADDLEQAVYGFDCWSELQLHTLIEQALTDSSDGVYREVRYPSAWHKRKKSEGVRCDFVLTQDGLPLRDPDLAGTLFSQQAAANAEDAYWIEVKVVKQFEAGSRSKKYAHDLLHPVKADVLKIWKDDRLHHAGLLLILFGQDQSSAEHDLQQWHTHHTQRGYPIAPPTIRGFKINDRVGNGWCGLGLYPVRRL
ncbi:hypothetical protein [Poriferisphaera sp. WC338]|uniref:hypothetical protein n=1 Tax=Poriferisphaera sp. WC338 TaxID=3425129 RepID=UPI003D81A722